MAGNHPKKSNERRDSSLKQQQRKNSAGGKNTPSSNPPTGTNTNNTNNSTNNNHGKVLLNNQKAQAAGAAILSAVTSPQVSGSTQQQQQQQSMGANGLNRGELVEFLNMRFSDALTAYHDTNLDPKIRPEKYESSKATTSAWSKNSNGVPSTWGQQPKQQPQQSNGVDNIGIMANGVDFLTELSVRSK